MTAPTWLRTDAVLAIHEQLLAEFGGSSGLRDSGLFESAIARPRNLLAYGAPSIVEMAAAYAFGLVKNHPFVDGNKRTGFTAAALFPELNGYRVSATEADAVVQTLALAAGEIGEAAYASWLGANSKKRRA